jgi:CHAT domain-containing protein/tetratricopeptide (TPR) repeat protein
MLPLVLAVLAAATPAPRPRPLPLPPAVSIRATLAGGDSVLYAIDVPADVAALVVVRQEGVDVSLTLRPEGAPLEHGLDMRAGVDGEERAYVPVAAKPATWYALVKPALPHPRRGDYVIWLDMAPADDHARALAAAHAQYQQASDDAWGGDAPSFRRAQAEYAAAAAAALAAGDGSVAAEATYQCARIHDSLGDQPGAIDWQLRALEAFRALGQRDREARVLNRLGDLSRKIGEVSDAERYFQEALPLAREGDDPVNVADILNNSGLLMLATGRLEDGIAQLQSAIPLAQEVDSPNVEGALNLNIGDGYSRLGVYEQAIDAYRRAFDVVGRLKLPRRSARALTALAEVQFESGNRAAADDAIAQALSLYEQSGDRTGTAETQALYGRMLHAGGEDEQAIALFAQARPVLHDGQIRLAEARVLATWATVDMDRGHADAALVKADEALRLARLIANPSTEQAALYVRAVALQKLNRVDEAIASIASATSGVESLRGSIQRAELRTSYLAKVRSYFDLQIDLLQQKGAVAAAFEVAERGRARTLLDGLAESAAKISRGVDPALVKAERAVQTQLNAKENYRVQVALRDGEASPRAAAIGRDIGRLLEQWNDLRVKIRVSSPEYAQLQAPEPVTLDRVQRTLLDAGSALVEYHLGAVRSYAWVIDRTSITVHPLPAAETIEAIARPYHELLSRDIDSLSTAARDEHQRRIAALGARLAAAVWKPLEARTRGRRLLIVADGVLQYVPFAALPASSGEPLVADHEIVYLPSASVLDSIRHRSRPIQATTPVAVFADPVFSINDPRFGQRRDATVPAQARASDGGQYGRLRFSRTEADAIVRVSPAAFAALDFTAAKETLATRNLRRYRVLHFATHGILNAEHPELSGLVLSLIDADGKPTDGFLRLHEIYNLDLDADLVVLSACRTALGREVHGEGLIGLTRGFMYAGASRVVSSVWNVDDRASAQLMARFYDAMFARGLSPASALREAQLSLLRQARWDSPHYWAAFGLQGDWK